MWFSLEEGPTEVSPRLPLHHCPPPLPYWGVEQQPEGADEDLAALAHTHTHTHAHKHTRSHHNVSLNLHYFFSDLVATTTYQGNDLSKGRCKASYYYFYLFFPFFCFICILQEIYSFFFFYCMCREYYIQATTSSTSFFLLLFFFWCHLFSTLHRFVNR